MKGNETLSQIEHSLGKIYENGSFSPHQLLNRLDENTTYIGRNLRTGENAERFLIKSLAWLIAFANKSGVPLEDAVLRRYPSYCPFCIESTCLCETTRRLPLVAQFIREEELEGKYQTIRGQIDFQGLKTTLDYFQQLFARLYPSNAVRWKSNPYETLKRLDHKRAKMNEFFRRLEAEPSGANKLTLAVTIADFFAWLIGIWDVVYRDVDGYSIQSVFTAHYRSGCPYCHAFKCRCVPMIRLGVRSDSQRIVSGQYESDPVAVLRSELETLQKTVRQLPEVSKQDIPIGGLTESAQKLSRSALVAEIEALQRDICSKTDSSALAAKFSRIIEWVNDNWPSKPNSGMSSQTVNVVVNTKHEAPMNPGDSYNIGQAGAVGLQAQNISRDQVWNAGGVDLKLLSAELSKLRERMRELDSQHQHDEAIGSVAAAQKAAEAGDRSTMVQKLKSAGKWTFDVAKDIGVSVAADVIKKSMGLP